MKRFAWAVVAVGVSACGGGGGGPSVDVSEEDLCTAVAEVACYDLYSCCTEGEIEDFLGVREPLTEEQCREDARILCERGTASAMWSAENDRLELNAAVLEDCLRAIIAPDDTCVVVASQAPWAMACVGSAWTGLVASGGSCFYDYECAQPRSTCGADRTCKPPASQGQECYAVQCAEGLYCDGSICQALRVEGSNCTGSYQCVEETFCDFNTGRCTAPAAIGAPCHDYNGCVPGASCLPGSCPDGNSCFVDADCSSVCESSGFFCFDDSDCGIGTCSVSGFSCYSNFDCNGGTDVCDFPYQCLPATCQGDSVCVENYSSFDYCEDALSNISLF